MVHFGNDWDTILDGEFAKTYYQNLRKFLMEEYRNYTIYPGMYDIFNALKYPLRQGAGGDSGAGSLPQPQSGARAQLFPCGKAWLRRRRW